MRSPSSTLGTPINSRWVLRLVRSGWCGSVVGITLLEKPMDYLPCPTCGKPHTDGCNITTCRESQKNIERQVRQFLQDLEIANAKYLSYSVRTLHA
jgi:hypothetical protein